MEATEREKPGEQKNLLNFSQKAEWGWGWGDTRLAAGDLSSHLRRSVRAMALWEA